MLKNPLPCPTLSIRCYRPAVRPALSARSKSSKSKGAPDLGRSQGSREDNVLKEIHSLVRALMPHLPPLEDDYTAEQICEEIKAGIAMLAKVIEAREIQQREHQIRLQADIQWEKTRRIDVEKQLHELSCLEELKTTKDLIRLEEADLQRKMTYIEQRMNETLALRDSFDRSVEERESELGHREASLKREEARVMTRARELHGKEKVLAAYEKALEGEKLEIAAEKAAFISVKSQWMASRPPPESHERKSMQLEDCQSRLFALHEQYLCLKLTEKQLRKQAEVLHQDKICLDDTTQMLEALHEEILQDRQDLAHESQLIQSEWDLIKSEKARLREMWKAVKTRKEEQISDPSTEESPGKHPEYRTPSDSWNAGFMSLQPVSFSESPVFVRKI